MILLKIRGESILFIIECLFSGLVRDDVGEVGEYRVWKGLKFLKILSFI